MQDDMPDTVPELQALVRALRCELAARGDKQATVTKATSAPTNQKVTMSSLFGRAKGKGDTLIQPAQPIVAQPTPKPNDAERRRLEELKRALDDDDIAELRKPMEHPLAASARKKHLQLNSGPGATISSIGFGTNTGVPVVPSVGGGGGERVSEEEEASGLVKQVIEEVAVESRRERLEEDEDELMEAKLRKLQGKK